MGNSTHTHTHTKGEEEEKNCTWVRGDQCFSLALSPICSVQSLSRVGLQHVRPPCPSPTPGAYSHSCLSSWWCHPSHLLLSPSPPTVNLSRYQGLSSESVLHIRWPKCWGFNFSIRPPNEYSVLISFRIDWFDIFAVQGTLKSRLL